MLRKTAAWTVIPALLATVITACSGGMEKKEEPAAAAPKSTEPVELVVVSTSGDSVDSWNERFGNLIKQKFPNYTITYKPSTKQFGIKEMLVSGEQMDLYFDSISFLTNGLLSNQLQFDMSELIKQNNIDYNRFEPSLIDAMKQLAGGKMYGIPVFNNNVVMYYNKDIFNKSGASYPKDGMTWDEFNELMKKIVRNDGNKQYVGHASSGTHVFRMNQLSLPYIDEKTGKSAINSEQWKKFIETAFVNPQLAGGYQDYFAKTNKGPYTNEFFQTQEVATFMLLSSSMFIDKNFDNFNWDLVAIPNFKELPGVGSQSYPTYFSVTQNSKHKNEAMEVIKYLISDEAQTEISKKGIMTVLKNDSIRKLFGSESRFKDKNLKAVFYNKFAPIPYKSVNDLPMESPYVKAVGSVLNGGDINTALRVAEEEANKRLQELTK